MKFNKDSAEFESTTRSNAHKDEKKAIKYMAEVLTSEKQHNRHGKFKNFLEVNLNTKIASVENKSEQKTHEPDLKINFESKDYLSLEVKFSGEGTALNTTLKNLDKEGQLKIDNIDHFIHTFKSTVRPNCMKEYIKNYHSILPDESKVLQEILDSFKEQEYGSSAFEKELATNRNKFNRFRAQHGPLQNCWNKYIDEHISALKIIHFNESFLSDMFKTRQLKEFVYLMNPAPKNTTKESQVAVLKYNAEKIKTKAEIEGKQIKIKDISNNRDLVRISFLHWKNGTGLSNFAINGFIVLQELYLTEKFYD
jgi:hypothetical protein